MAISEKSLEQIKADAEQEVRNYNEALKKGDLKAMTTAENNLKASEAEYLEVKQHEVFCWLKSRKNPLLEAVVQRAFETLKHASVRENGVLMGIATCEKERQIDLVAFCKFCEKDSTWEYKVEKLGQMLCMRSAKELGVTGVQLKEIATSYYMKELAQKEQLGQTPMSNNQVCKALQTVIDAIPFDEGTSLKVNAHDVAYLLACYTKRGKKALSVQVAKASFVHSLLVDVCHRVATGKVYSVEFKQERQKVEAPAADAKPAPVSPETEAPKAEGSPIEAA